MNLTNENYFSKEARAIYTGVSEFKEFMKCEAEALAMVKGEYEKPKTQALMVGSYIDAYFSNEMDDFIKQNPDIFKKDGTLKSEYEQAEQIIKFLEEDEMMMKYLNGLHQIVMTGVIAGVPVKIKIDSYHPGKIIVDQKVMKDLEPVWVDGVGKVNFVEAFGYDIQAGVYQEVVRQNTIDAEHPDGLKLPFVLAVATKEEVPSKALLEIDQDTMDRALELFKTYAPRFQDIKAGKIKPNRCGKCNYCKKTNKVTGFVPFRKFFGLEE